MITITTNDDMSELVFRNSETEQIVVAYIKEHSVTEVRELGKHVLEAEHFGGECLRVLRDMALNPMKGRELDEAMMSNRWKGMKT